MVLIQFPGLNMVCYDEGFLLGLAFAMGRLVKVDVNTINTENSCYARICIEFDLVVPIVGKVWFRNYWYKVEYEGLHRIMFQGVRVMGISLESAMLDPNNPHQQKEPNL